MVSLKLLATIRPKELATNQIALGKGTFTATSWNAARRRWQPVHDGRGTRCRNRKAD